MSEEKINIWVNKEDVQNIIDCYEKDIEYIKKLEQENQQLKEKINGVYEERDYLYNKTTTESKYIIQQLKDRIDKAIQILKLCNSQCAEETIKILKGDKE